MVDPTTAIHDIPEMPEPPDPPPSRLRQGEKILLSRQLYEIAPAFKTVFGDRWREALDADAAVLPLCDVFTPTLDIKDVLKAVVVVLEARPDWAHDYEEILATALESHAERVGRFSRLDAIDLRLRKDKAFDRGRLATENKTRL